MEINITYKSPEHEAAFLSELQRIPHIVNPESGRVNPYWGASLYLLSALTRWPELRIAVIGDDYMAFAAAKEAFNLSQNERIVVELAANFYNAGLFCMPGFEMVCATCDTAFALILEAFRLRRAKLFFQRWGGVRRTIIKYYEVSLADGYSIAIKGVRAPSLDEASLFLKRDLKPGDKVVDVTEIPEEEVRLFFECEYIDQWPVFGTES